MDGNGLSGVERVRELARLVGIGIDESEIEEVSNRFHSLIGELERLNGLELDRIEPVVIFPDDEYDDREAGA